MTLKCQILMWACIDVHVHNGIIKRLSAVSTRQPGYKYSKQGNMYFLIRNGIQYVIDFCRRNLPKLLSALWPYIRVVSKETGSSLVVTIYVIFSVSSVDSIDRQQRHHNCSADGFVFREYLFKLAPTLFGATSKSNGLERLNHCGV
jgi:hypothetical protein